MSAIYLMWSDPRPKVALATKIADAAKAYEERFKVKPLTAIIHPDDAPQPFNAADYPVAISLNLRVGRSIIWIGQE